VTFGNLAQLGIPMATALFDETGLSIHLAIVSVHALTLLSILTVLVELDLARSEAQGDAGRSRLARTLRMTVRNTLIHPIVLPVLAGMAWNLTDWPIPDAVDETLQMLGQAVVPVCLIAIGMSLAHYGIRGGLRGAFALAAAKLLALPLLVLLVSHFAFGLSGLPLTVMVMCAAMPSGTNVIMFAQRYRTLEAETTTAMVLSTLAFAITAPLWLWLLSRL
jgi:predicted permease